MTNRFKISRWVKPTEKDELQRLEKQASTKHPRHRAHRYWSRPR
jgi:hypothetical protein